MEKYERLLIDLLESLNGISGLEPCDKRSLNGIANLKPEQINQSNSEGSSSNNDSDKQSE